MKAKGKGVSTVIQLNMKPRIAQIDYASSVIRVGIKQTAVQRNQYAQPVEKKGIFIGNATSHTQTGVS